MLTYLIEKNSGLSTDLRKNIYVLSEVQRILHENGEHELGKKFEDAFDRHYNNLQLEEPDRSDY